MVFVVFIAFCASAVGAENEIATTPTNVRTKALKIIRECIQEFYREGCDNTPTGNCGPYGVERCGWVADQVVVQEAETLVRIANARSADKKCPLLIDALANDARNDLGPMQADTAHDGPLEVSLGTQFIRRMAIYELLYMAVNSKECSSSRPTNQSSGPAKAGR